MYGGGGPNRRSQNVIDAEERERLAELERKRKIRHKLYQLRVILRLEEKLKKTGTLNSENDSMLKEFRSEWPASDFPKAKIEEIEREKLETYKRRLKGSRENAAEFFKGEPWDKQYYDYLNNKYSLMARLFRGGIRKTKGKGKSKRRQTRRN